MKATSGAAAESAAQRPAITGGERKKKTGPIWARLTGFPYWPARHCSAYEEQCLRAKKNPKAGSASVAVSFLGPRCERGWVFESAVTEFNAESLTGKNFIEKKFNSDKEYRMAVIEGIRLGAAIRNEVQKKAGLTGDPSPLTGKDFSEAHLNLTVIPPNQGHEQLQIDLCDQCGGTAYSGPSLVCALCDVKVRHMHCLNLSALVPDPLPNTAQWLCDTCAESTGVPLGIITGIPGSLHPVPAASSSSLSSSSSIALFSPTPVVVQQTKFGNTFEELRASLNNYKLEKYGRAVMPETSLPIATDATAQSGSNVAGNSRNSVSSILKGIHRLTGKNENNDDAVMDEHSNNNNNNNNSGNSDHNNSTLNGDTTNNTVSTGIRKVPILPHTALPQPPYTMANKNTNQGIVKKSHKKGAGNILAGTGMGPGTGTSDSMGLGGSIGGSSSSWNAGPSKQQLVDPMKALLAAECIRGNNGNSSKGTVKIDMIATQRAAAHLAPRPSIQSQRQTRLEGSARAPVEDVVVGEDDRCFVCGEGGRLVLCDFPGCPRVYHQICILTTFPVPLGEECYSEDYEGSWYCPRHQCVCCDALQLHAEPRFEKHRIAASSTSAGSLNALSMYTNEHIPEPTPATPGQGPIRYFPVQENKFDYVPLSVAILQPPMVLPTQLKSKKKWMQMTTVPGAAVGGVNGHAVADPVSVNMNIKRVQKHLRSCVSCPFAVCGECETAIGGAKGLLKTLRGSAYSGKGLTCLNCASTNPVLRLARYLEGALCKAAASRLAMPFMRPLLPSPPPLNTQTQDANCFSQSDSSLPLCSDPLILPSAPSSSSSSSSSKATHNSSTSGEEGEETANSNTKQKTDLTRNNNVVKGSSEEMEEKRKNDAHTQPEDLLHVLEKVRDLQYKSVESFFRDLSILRNSLVSSILNAVKNESNKSNMAPHSSSHLKATHVLSSPLLHAYDTIVDCCKMYLAARSVALSVVQEDCDKRALEEKEAQNKVEAARHRGEVLKEYSVNNAAASLPPPSSSFPSSSSSSFPSSSSSSSRGDNRSSTSTTEIPLTDGTYASSSTVRTGDRKRPLGTNGHVDEGGLELGEGQEGKKLKLQKSSILNSTSTSTSNLAVSAVDNVVGSNLEANRNDRKADNSRDAGYIDGRIDNSGTAVGIENIVRGSARGSEKERRSGSGDLCVTDGSIPDRCTMANKKSVTKHVAKNTSDIGMLSNTVTTEEKSNSNIDDNIEMNIDTDVIKSNGSGNYKSSGKTSSNSNTESKRDNSSADDMDLHHTQNSATSDETLDLDSVDVPGSDSPAVPVPNAQETKEKEREKEMLLMREKEKDREREKAEGKERERERAKYVLAVMNRLWRVECRRCIGEGVGVTASSSSGSGSEGTSRRGGYSVLGRSLKGWESFVSEGSETLKRGSLIPGDDPIRVPGTRGNSAHEQDPWGMGDYTRDYRGNEMNDEATRKSVAAFLQSSVPTDDMDVAEMIISLHTDSDHTQHLNKFGHIPESSLGSGSGSTSSRQPNPFLDPFPLDRHSYNDNTQHNRHRYGHQNGVDIESDNRYDSVALLEGARDDSNAWSKKHQSFNRPKDGMVDQVRDRERERERERENDRGMGNLSGDDTLLLLDRMRDLTARTLHLQARLRREYQQRKEALVSTGIETITIGEATLLQELGLANDNLKWRLQQRSRALTASQMTVSILEGKLASAEVRAVKSETERDAALKKLALLEAKQITAGP